MRGALTLAALLVAATAAEAIVAPPHHFPGFHAAVGAVSCAVVVAVSKWIGKVALQRPEEPGDA